MTGKIGGVEYLAEVLEANPELKSIAAEARADPECWAFWTLKGHLVKQMGLEAAHDVWTIFLSEFGPIEPGLAPLQSLRTMARANAAFYRTFSAAGPTDFPAVEVLGGPRMPPVSIRARELFLTRLDSATTYGRSNLCDFSGTLCTDFQSDEAERYRTDWWFDPIILGRRGQEVFIHRPVERSLHLEEAIDLTGAFSPGWGHSVLEFAPKVLMAERESSIDAEIPLLVDANLPETTYEMFRFLSGGRRQIVKLGFRQAAQVSRMWTSASPEFWPALRAAGEFARPELSSINPPALADLLANAPRPDKAGDPSLRRLFFARGGPQPRLANQSELIEHFRANGFIDVYPEALSFIEQYRLVLNATHIAGPAGSQLALAALFGNPEMKVLILHGPDLTAASCWAAPFATRGQRVHIVRGELIQWNDTNPYNSHYSISSNEITTALLDWL